MGYMSKRANRLSDFVIRVTLLCRYEELGCLHDIFERQARLTPSKIAIVDDIRRVTFQELNEACDVLADRLVSLGVGPDRPVGIYMERCLEYAIAYISILKAGKSFCIK